MIDDGDDIPEELWPQARKKGLRWYLNKKKKIFLARKQMSRAQYRDIVTSVKNEFTYFRPRVFAKIPNS